jgi:integrase
MTITEGDDPEGEELLKSHVRQLQKEIGISEGFLEALASEGDDWSFVIKLSALMEGALTHLLTETIGRQELRDAFAHLDLGKPITTITAADLRALRAARAAASQAKCAATKRQDAKRGEAGANRLMQRVRHLFTWAIEHDHVAESPFRKGHATIVKANRDAETPRDRRLTGDEETRLLAAANPRLYALIVAALTTGCRKGELLSMQWAQVRETPKPEIRLSASNTKTDKPRTVPLTARLKAVLAMRKTGPDGQEHGPDAFVFGNEVGEQAKNIKTAWEYACRRAKITDLHFHDLRRECGSRWHEAGVPLVQIQAWLGHSNIVQTSTYLAVSLAGTDEALRLVEAFEAAGGFAHRSHKPAADPTSDASEASSAADTQQVVM